ncbi:MAG: TIGR04551 family protein, partial [Deltaproteobacteria bacterium]|nr:TIGR04551 family protein [Deltaproteobacteria bacterium]
MARALLAALLLTPALALAEDVDGGTPAPSAASTEEVRREVDQKLEQAKRELKDQLAEIRGQYAAHAASQQWQDAWVEQKRKLELFTLDGYLRLRPDLFNKFDLNRPADPDGFTLWQQSPTGAKENTQAGANLRLRLEPSLNVSEEVRVRMQVDVLDNLVMGSTPDSRLGSESTSYDLFSEGQSVLRTGVNAVKDSLSFRRVWGEVGTPVGILRFGRMGSHWGLGMLRNDGNCLDCDHGDSVDRVQFVTEPLPGLYVTPMLDFNAEGPSSATLAEGGQPFDLSNRDDANGLVLAVARRDTDAQARARLDNGLAVFNYGLHFTWRT